MRFAAGGSRRFARLARTASARSLIVVALIGVAMGCEGPASSPSGSGTASPELQLRYACGTFAFDPAFLNRGGNAEQGADPIAVALRAHLARPGQDFDSLPEDPEDPPLDPLEPPLELDPPDSPPDFLVAGLW